MKTKNPGKMINAKDSRINARFTSKKEFLFLFFILAMVNGFHMWIYLTLLKKGFFDSGLTNLQIGIIALMGWVLFMAAFVTAIVVTVRHVSWDRPMRRISEATRKVASGDFSVRIPPIRKDGKKDYVEVMFDDFNTMVKELGSIETMKTDFISAVSHELKTPVAIILNYAEALKAAGRTGNDRDEYAQTIIDASKRLSLLISNILKLNKLENQKIIINAKPFNLGEQMRQCLLACEDLWEKKDIALTADIDDITVNYDDTMTELVWNNLLSNAVKFTGRGGSVFVSVKQINNDATVTIRDSGCGMDEETQKHIFDKFYQGDSSRSSEGNGLGLALVRQVLDITHGNISVESRKNAGSVFTVRLPV